MGINSDVIGAAGFSASRKSEPKNTKKLAGLSIGISTLELTPAVVLPSIRSVLVSGEYPPVS
jgi:hypothetical protein